MCAYVCASCCIALKGPGRDAVMHAITGQGVQATFCLQFYSPKLNNNSLIIHDEVLWLVASRVTATNSVYVFYRCYVSLFQKAKGNNSMTLYLLNTFPPGVLLCYWPLNEPLGQVEHSVSTYNYCNEKHRSANPHLHMQTLL